MLCSRSFLFAQVRFNHSWIKPNGYDTGIQVYNCITKTKVPFIVRNKNHVTWYTCGPTVYDSAHIGHASCFVKLDIIQRILKHYFQINLVTVMNITDIDDKIIKKSLETNQSPKEISQHYEKEFWEDMKSLKVAKPSLILRVTEHIPLIEKFIAKLLNSKHAYRSEDGSVLFNIKTSQAYGKLQNITQKNSEVNDLDPEINFTLWKKAKQNEPAWDSTFDPGRPGWHTECSALASSVFGSSIDVHAGGIDLRFPHHENEEAQCCAFFSKPQWVNYWFHTGHLLQNSTKMSKSLKNTVTISDVLKTCDADVFRAMCLMSHYRNNMEYSDEYVKSAKRLLEGYKHFVANCRAFISGKLKAKLNGDILCTQLTETVKKVDDALRNDFDTATCIKVLNSLIGNVNKMLHPPSAGSSDNLSELSELLAILNFVTNFFDLFGIQLGDSSTVENEYGNVASLIDILIEFRQDVRQLGINSKDQKLLRLCDGVRNNLKNYGVIVKDHGKMSSWSK